MTVSSFTKIKNVWAQTFLGKQNSLCLLYSFHNEHKLFPVKGKAQMTLVNCIP